MIFSQNIAVLRALWGYSQEEVAQQVGITRQAYAKWEKGESLPDLQRAFCLARIYHTTLDNLVQNEIRADCQPTPASSGGRYIFGTVRMNDRGQILIPRKARALFSLEPNENLVILGDEQEGLAIIKAQVFEKYLNRALIPETPTEQI